MNRESRKCQNCQKTFVIEPEDFKFYEKIKVPPPTWCPECRAQRRLAFRSGIKLYKRKVEGRDAEIFSSVPSDSPFRIFDEDYWWADSWDSMDYGQEYDFSRPFFEQLKGLSLQVPIPHRRVLNGVRSEYCNNAVYIKDCYLCFNAGWTENSMYSETINRSRDCIDTLKIEDCESSYELFDCKKCFNTFFSSECNECVDVWFSKNLVGCQYCFGCVNLRNKKYHIFNKPYSRDEYLKKVKEFNLGSFALLEELQKKVIAHFAGFPVKYMHGSHNVNAQGDYLDNCKAVKESYYCRDLENCSYCQLILFLKSADCMDIAIAGGQLCYELQEAGGYNVKFSYMCLPKDAKSFSSGAVDLEYSMFSFDVNNLFGCIGLRNKQYCILNKQYTKEEYEKLREKIIKHMNEMPYTDNAGRVYRYGEFFPPEFSQFPYDDTWAQEYFPLTKDQALDKGYSWKDPEPRNYEITLKTEDLPDHIKDVPDSILNEIIQCAHFGHAMSKCNEQCTEAYKIIPQELQFLRKMNLPLPRLCPNCRHYQRIKQRNPLKLWHRKCQCAGATSHPSTSSGYSYRNTADHIHHKKEEPCPNEFETTYAPERPEIVYCEQCYLREVV